MAAWTSSLGVAVAATKLLLGLLLAAAAAAGYMYDDMRHRWLLDESSGATAAADTGTGTTGSPAPLELAGGAGLPVVPLSLIHI